MTHKTGVQLQLGIMSKATSLSIWVIPNALIPIKEVPDSKIHA